MEQSRFLTAEWRKLMMANYPVDPALLRPYLPAFTVLDEWEGRTWVSLVGFAFREVKLSGLSIPFHRAFPEVNLRFYVRYREGETWKRGVVFISEIVPKPAIVLVANGLFKEKYRSLPMRILEEEAEGRLRISYQWKYRGSWNELGGRASKPARGMQEGGFEEFITEHFWGYSKISAGRTGEYHVTHRRWEVYDVEDYTIRCNFGGLYGDAFGSLAHAEPESVFLAEGSPIAVHRKKILGH